MKLSVRYSMDLLKKYIFKYNNNRLMKQIPQTLIRKHKILLNKIIMFILYKIFVIFFLYFIIIFLHHHFNHFVCVCF